MDFANQANQRDTARAMSRESVERVRRGIEAFNRRDAETLSALATDDVEWYPAFTGGGIVEGAVYRGHDGIRGYLEDLGETWAEITIENLKLEDLGEQILVRADLRAIGRTSRLEITARIGAVYTFRGEKVAQARVYPEERRALEAVGLRGS